MSILPLYHGDNDRDGRRGVWKRVRRRLLSIRLDTPTHAITIAAATTTGVLAILVVYYLLAAPATPPPARPPLPPPPPVPPPPPPADAADVAAEKGGGTSGEEGRADGREREMAVDGEGGGAATDGARRAAVKAAFVHAYGGYREHAFGHDEIRPTTNATNDSWGGFGAVLVDGLDTMMLMGLGEWVAEAREHVAGIRFATDYSASFFETTIRYLGGLLSAYALSGDDVYLDKARELGDALLPAFDSPTGLPYHEVNLKTGEARNPAWNHGNAILSEVGSVQLEFKALSHFTNEPKYGAAADRAMDVLERLAPRTVSGLYPVYISAATGEFADTHVTLGALADSFYEYLLKQWLLTGKREDRYKRMYDAAMAGMRKHLVASAGPHVYIGEQTAGSFVPLFDHLMCFVPGMLALSGSDADVELAVELADTCWALYADQKSGLAPDVVVFNADGSYRVKSANYLLRPETIESFYVLHQVTGDGVWKERAWTIFLAIERHCRTPAAYSGVADVRGTARSGGQAVELNNSMQSFFLAETLKYLYLLFGGGDGVSIGLDSDWVFTTEAHPLPVFRTPPP